MKFGLILLFSILSSEIMPASNSINGDNASQYAYVIVNDTCLRGCFQGWIGLVYVNSLWESDYLDDNWFGGTDYASVYCIVYIQPGDSVHIKDSTGSLNQTFYFPDTVWDNESGETLSCEPINASSTFTIIIQYFPDSFEQQYLLNRFGQSYLDSIKAELTGDSLKTSDSLAAIQNLQSGKQNTIYPNPTTGILNFTNYYPANGTAGVEIFDVSGREVIQQNFEVSPGLQTNPIYMGNLPNGVYLVQYTVNGNRRTEKVIKM